MVSLKLLQSFVTLVKTKSFTRTAETLHITQPTVSKNIDQLENELHVTLFVKAELAKKRTIKLTEIGQRVYIHAIKILNNQQDLLIDIQNYRDLKVGTLRMGVPPLGAQLLTSTLFDFHQKWSDIELSFLEVGSKGIEQALINHQLDVGVLLAPIDEEKFYKMEICNYPLMVVVRSDSEWAKKSIISLEELKNQSFLLFQENFSLNQRILDACKLHDFVPNIVCRSSQWNLLADMVFARMGITLLPKYYTDLLDHRFSAIPLHRPNIEWHLVMAWRKDILPSPAVNAWLESMRQNF
ncbi:LysR family transcriptional regulator [Acinetobacter pollinis]|uniref:LysR family transcriptional regulator n=1 Tax=Acinetobacter pollinis TaxID=2605270 RepID=UPI0018A2933F|nr:LysR family transcriptional regulator [Acinetobacter pollinis]MBF7691451.1 LysR family transcriptional regulator [Acinetobacter pollinis]MBF7693714.1 LysR family transcriptional regulator [Acinetobacter pollinis]MBF7698810.1 LysR family transcriptional regulator [Acinetobacter pollinis]MBF7701233.1 LysR family transcriptional regulator [Acinetobacter pollinis]